MRHDCKRTAAGCTHYETAPIPLKPHTGKWVTTSTEFTNPHPGTYAEGKDKWKDKVDDAKADGIKWANSKVNKFSVSGTDWGYLTSWAAQKNGSEFTDAGHLHWLHGEQFVAITANKEYYRMHINLSRRLTTNNVSSTQDGNKTHTSSLWIDKVKYKCTACGTELTAAQAPTKEDFNRHYTSRPNF